MKISKNKKMRFILMSQGSLNPKIRFLGQKVCSVACVHTHTLKERHTNTKVNTEDTLSGFQEFFLQPFIKNCSIRSASNACNHHRHHQRQSQRFTFRFDSHNDERSNGLRFMVALASPFQFLNTYPSCPHPRVVQLCQSIGELQANETITHSGIVTSQGLSPFVLEQRV